jgi:hypothetical protein
LVQRFPAARGLFPQKSCESLTAMTDFALCRPEAAQPMGAALKSLSYLAELFRRDVSMKQFSAATKPFSVFEQISGNSDWLSS